MKIFAVIPARMGSTRFPGKPLAPILGRPMIEHVYRQACKASAQSVLIATDSPQVQQAAQAFGGRAILTSARHQSGSDRIAECVERMAWPDDTVVVNLQGDEPAMPPALIGHCATLLHEAGWR